MPRNPNQGEERNEYASFCIEYMINHDEYPNTKKGRSQAAGQCYSLYDEWRKKQKIGFDRSTILMGGTVFNEI